MIGIVIVDRVYNQPNTPSHGKIRKLSNTALSNPKDYKVGIRI